MTARYYSIIGLPRSGKTTFLAALWHQIDAGEVSTKLKLDKLVGDHQYLNRIVDAWRRCEEVPHTSMAAEVSVSIHVREAATGRAFVLGFPDLSGESFKQQLDTRTCRASYVTSLGEAQGMMLFVNADRGQDGLTILDLGPVLDGADLAERAGAGVDWSPELVPEQVCLVELLQFLQRPPFRRERRRVALVVSAWDVVADPRPSPADWVERELPLLHQFLTTNPQHFEFRAYGVSAQGGNLASAQRDALLRQTPSERIECHGPDAAQHDLTSPIVWLATDD